MKSTCIILIGRWKNPHIEYFPKMRKSSLKASQIIYCVLKNETLGSPALGFTQRAVYDNLAKEDKRILKGGGAKYLVITFEDRAQKESDFFYLTQLDRDDHLVSFFWRDSHMKIDCLLFGHLLVFDNTYQTNKSRIICAPFVCMNHHANNVMVRCGFLINEKVDSFIWLFNTFLRLMDDIAPEIIMTDQAFSMANAIVKVFPTSSRDRVCGWHIKENSRCHINHLRMLPGFVTKFDCILFRCDIEYLSFNSVGQGNNIKIVPILTKT